MAMPHANVFHAVRDPMNGIIQPQDLEGNGEYTVHGELTIRPTRSTVLAGQPVTPF